MIFLACATLQMDLVRYYSNIDRSHLQFRTQNISFITQIVQDMGIELFLIIFGVSLSALTLFYYCYHGQSATDYLAAFADCLYGSEWMNLSTMLQKPFVFMIAHAQIPRQYHGYGIVSLNLETFSKVNFE